MEIGSDFGRRKELCMAHALSIALTSLMVLIGITGSAFAGIIATPVPEPATLTLLAIGFGGAAAVRYFKRK